MSKESTKKKKQENTKSNSEKNTYSKKRNDYLLEIKELKKELKLAHASVSNLTKKVIELESENQKNIRDFQEKAKGFASKAQKEVKRLKNEIAEKQAHDLKHHKKYGSQKLLESILDPIINIAIAVKAGKNNETVKPYVIGFEMLLTQLENELATYGVFKISPDIGSEYDPEVMQAIKKEGKGMLVKVVKKPGFKLHERTLIPATVEIG